MRKWIGGLIAVVLGFSLTFSISAQEFKLPQGKSGEDFVKEAKSHVHGISITEAKRIMDDSSDDTKFIDVRPLDERRKFGHLPGKESWLPAGRLIFDATKRLPNKNRHLVTYCKKGKRSAVAAYQLKQMGYSNVEYLEGGVLGWKNAGYPLTKFNNPEYAKIDLPTGKTADDFLREAKSKAKGISPQEAKRIIDSNPEVVILDVKTQVEDAIMGWIKGSLRMEAGKVPFNIKKKVHNALTPIIVNCGTGKRALLVAAQLGEMGYENVSYIEGGVTAWKKAGFPVEKK